MKNSEAKYIVGIGEALWDMLPDGRKVGGAPANFTYHAAQFDLPSRVVSAVGDDELGHEILDILADKGLECKIATVDYPTGTVEVTLDEQGIPQYEICEGVAWDNIPLDEELLDLAHQCRAVCYGTLAQRSEQSRAAITAFLEATPENCLRVCDINLRGTFYSKELIEASIKKCNILKINDEEIVKVGELLGFDATDYDSASQHLIESYGLDMVILTCGADCSHIYTRQGEHSYRTTPKVEVADTVGAGDSFTGAFVAAMLAGCELGKAHSLAVDVAAYVCTQPGAMPSLPAEFKHSVER